MLWQEKQHVGSLILGETESSIRAEHCIDQRHLLWKTVMMLERIITSSPYFKINGYNSKEKVI